MKKFEDIYEGMELPAEIAEKYKEICQCLHDIEELTGESEFGNVLELEGEDWDYYCELRSCLVQVITDVVKKQDQAFDFQVVSRHFGNDDFWEEIGREVSDQTQNFLSMQPLRRSGLEERRKHYKDIFTILYTEYENANYAGEKLGLDKKVAALYVRLLRFSEDFVINHYLSRRLFDLRLDSYCGLQEDADFLWELYSEKRGEIEKIALNNRLNDLNYRLFKLTSQLEDLQENLEFMEYLVMKNSQTE